MQKHRDGKEYDTESANKFVMAGIRLFRATGKLERLEGLRREASGATWGTQRKASSSLPQAIAEYRYSVSKCLIYCDSIKKLHLKRKISGLCYLRKNPQEFSAGPVVRILCFQWSGS